MCHMFCVPLRVLCMSSVMCCVVRWRLCFCCVLRVVWCVVCILYGVVCKHWKCFASNPIRPPMSRLSPVLYVCVYMMFVHISYTHTYRHTYIHTHRLQWICEAPWDVNSSSSVNQLWMNVRLFAKTSLSLWAWLQHYVLCFRSLFGRAHTTKGCSIIKSMSCWK